MRSIKQIVLLSFLSGSIAAQTMVLTPSAANTCSTTSTSITCTRKEGTHHNGSYLWGLNPPSALITVSSTGGTLTWTAALSGQLTTICTYTTPCAALTQQYSGVALTSGSTASPIVVKVLFEGFYSDNLYPGVYTGAATFTPSIGSPQVITINLVVAPASGEVEANEPNRGYPVGPSATTTGNTFADVQTLQNPYMAVPAVCGSYVDPNFGGLVKRITPFGYFLQYGSNTPFSANGTYVATQNSGYTHIIRISDCADMTGPINPGSAGPSNTLMSAINDTRLYYMAGAEIHSYNFITTADTLLGTYSGAPYSFTSLGAGGTMQLTTDDWLSFYDTNAGGSKLVCAVNLPQLVTDGAPAGTNTWCHDWSTDPGAFASNKDWTGVWGVDATSGKRYVVLMGSPIAAVYSVGAAGVLDLSFSGPNVSSYGGYGVLNDDQEPCSTLDGICMSSSMGGLDHATLFRDRNGNAQLFSLYESDSDNQWYAAFNQINKTTKSLRMAEEPGGGMYWSQIIYGSNEPGSSDALGGVVVGPQLPQGTPAWAAAITSVTAANPPVITLANTLSGSTHVVRVDGGTGAWVCLNGYWTATVTGSTITLTGATCLGAGSFSGQTVYIGDSQNSMQSGSIASIGQLIVIVPGIRVKQVAMHRAVSWSNVTGSFNYNAEAKTSLSRDGAMISYMSNFGYIDPAGPGVFVAYTGIGVNSSPSPVASATLVTSGSVLDYYATAGGYYSGAAQVYGDTTYTAWGGSGSTVINYGDGTGNHTITGSVAMTLNDFQVGASTMGNVGLVKINTVDVGTPANTSITLLNAMSDYGTMGNALDSPAGWHGKGTSADTTITGSSWKTGPPFNTANINSLNGLALPICRKDGSSGYITHDCTLVWSPDFGLHWCNPNTFFNRSGGPGCDASNWSSTGDAPKCDAASSSTACTNTSYLNAAHSSVMWKDPVTNDTGTGQLFGVPFFITMARDVKNMISSNLPCPPTCFPNPKQPWGSYVYGYVFNGGQTLGSGMKLFRVPDDVTHILDPLQYTFYICANYSNTNVCDGTNGANWTTDISSATNLWTIASSYTVPLNGWIGGSGNSLWSTPFYTCLSTPCLLMMEPTSWNRVPAITSQTPWGPFLGPTTTQGSVYQSFSNLSPFGYGFPHVAEWSLRKVNTSSSLNMRGLFIWSNLYWQGAQPIASISAAATAIITVTNPFPGPWTGYVTATTGGATGCWAAINSGTASLAYVDAYHAQVVGADTSSCTGSSYGSPVFAGEGSVGDRTVFFQPVDFNTATSNLGSGLFGGAGTRFSMESSAGTLPRNSLAYYFDFRENGGSTSWTPVSTYDQARVMYGAFQILPTVAMASDCSGLATTGDCVGGIISTTKWTAQGINTATNNYAINSFTLQQPVYSGGTWTKPAYFQDGAAGTPSVFPGNTAWTISLVTKITSTSPWNVFAQFGAQSAYNSILLSNNGYTSNQLEIRFHEGNSSNYDDWLTTSTTAIPQNTWVHLVISYPGGTNGGNPATPVVYVNGVNLPGAWGSGGGTHGGAYVNIGTGPMSLGCNVVGPGCGTYGSTQTAANLAIWKRALSPTEIVHAYRAMQGLMKNRGVTLP